MVLFDENCLIIASSPKSLHRGGKGDSAPQICKGGGATQSYNTHF